MDETDALPKLDFTIMQPKIHHQYGIAAQEKQGQKRIGSIQWTKVVQENKGGENAEQRS